MSHEPVLDNILGSYEKLFSAEKKVADYVLANPYDVIDLNVVELASESQVSDATVIRFCKHIGYAGYHQFRIMLARTQAPVHKQEESNNPDKVNDVFANYTETIHQISENRENAMVMDRCIKLIENCEMVHIIAEGNTSILSQYLGFRLERMGIRATYTQVPAYFMNHINLASSCDIVVGISKSGSTKAVIRGMELAAEKGLQTIAITRSRQSFIAKVSKNVLISSGIKESFNYHKDYDHFNEIVLINVLIQLLLNSRKSPSGNAETLEYIMSEDKL
jgi:RpiR family carbohydrate utilization transcriptional regulator